MQTFDSIVHNECAGEGVNTWGVDVDFRISYLRLFRSGGIKSVTRARWCVRMRGHVSVFVCVCQCLTFVVVYICLLAVGRSESKIEIIRRVEFVYYCPTASFSALLAH